MKRGETRNSAATFLANVLRWQTMEDVNGKKEQDFDASNRHCSSSGEFLEYLGGRVCMALS